MFVSRCTISRGTQFLPPTEGRLVYEGRARFTEEPLRAGLAPPLVLARPRPSKFTAERLYNEQWLFHGPPMQALTEVAPVSQDGISGTITVRPLAASFGAGSHSIVPHRPDRP